MNIQLIEFTCDYSSHKLRSAEEPSQHLPMRDRTLKNLNEEE
jgi:hypothetical protein